MSWGEAKTRRPSRDDTMMRVAFDMSEQATCIKRRVGCVLTNERGRVLAAAYNGVAAGMPHCNAEKLEGRNYKVDEEHSRKVGAKVEKPQLMVTVFPHACNGGRPFPPGADLCEAVHAESNALRQCRDPDEVFSVYATVQPCYRCVKELLNTGARRILFAEEYQEEPQGLELWRRAGRDAIWLRPGPRFWVAASEAEKNSAASLANQYRLLKSQLVMPGSGGRGKRRLPPKRRAKR